MESFASFTEQHTTETIKKHGAFFAFGQSQFDEQSQEGVRYVNMGNGLIAPKDNAAQLVKDLDDATENQVKEYLAKYSRKDIIWYELANRECHIVCDWTDAAAAVKVLGITAEEVEKEYNPFFNHCVEKDYF